MRKNETRVPLPYTIILYATRIRKFITLFSSSNHNSDIQSRNKMRTKYFFLYYVENLQPNLHV